MLLRCPSAHHQRCKGRDLGLFRLPQVGHLAVRCAALPAGTSVVCSQGTRRVPGVGSLVSGAKRRPNSSTFLPHGDLSCPRDLGYCPRVASVQLSLLDAYKVGQGRNEDPVSSPLSVLPAPPASCPSRHYVGDSWEPEAARSDPAVPSRSRGSVSGGRQTLGWQQGFAVCVLPEPCSLEGNSWAL